MVKVSDTGGGNFKPLSAGTHLAICDMVIDLGMQEPGPNSRFRDPKHKVYFRFQVPGERIQYEYEGQEVDRPAVIGRDFTASLSEKGHLRPFLESWRGRAFTAEELREFELNDVAGIPCMLNVIHEPGNKAGKPVIYANIAAIMPIPKGTAKPVLEGEVIVHDDDNDNYDKLPEWLQKKLDAAIDDEDPPVEQSSRQRPQTSAFDDDLDDQVPF
jgi:hypothetical protein